MAWVNLVIPANVVSEKNEGMDGAVMAVVPRGGTNREHATLVSCADKLELALEEDRNILKRKDIFYQMMLIIPDYPPVRKLGWSWLLSRRKPVSTLRTITSSWITSIMMRECTKI